MENGTKNITLKVNAELYEKFRKYCKEKGLIIYSLKFSWRKNLERGEEYEYKYYKEYLP